MSDPGNESSEGKPEPSDAQLSLFNGDRDRIVGVSEELRDLLLIERERIESQNKRTEVVRLAVEMNDASDKRQYDFQMAQLNAQVEGTRRKYTLATWLSSVSIAIGTCLLSLLFWALFFGSKDQSEMSMSVLKIIGYGLGGYGAIGAGVRGVRRLIGSMGSNLPLP